MASFTTDYTLADSAWTQVSVSKNTVIIYNPGFIPVHYAVAAIASDLANVVGHELNFSQTIKLDGLGTSSQNVFIKSYNTGGGAKASVSAY